jgi:hypothetical protein
MTDKIEHTKTQHEWSERWASINDVDCFSGMECECGARILPPEMVNIIRHYYGNRMHLEVITDKIIYRYRYDS